VFRFRTIVYRPQKKIQPDVGETVGIILNTIKNNPKITRKGLSEKTDLSIRGIEWNLKKMKKNGILKRIGSTKSGYWQISKK